MRFASFPKVATIIVRSKSLNLGSAPGLRPYPGRPDGRLPRAGVAHVAPRNSPRHAACETSARQLAVAEYGPGVTAAGIGRPAAAPPGAAFFGAQLRALRAHGRAKVSATWLRHLIRLEKKTRAVNGARLFAVYTIIRLKHRRIDVQTSGTYSVNSSIPGADVSRCATDPAK